MLYIFLEITTLRKQDLYTITLGRISTSLRTTYMLPTTWGGRTQTVLTNLDFLVWTTIEQKIKNYVIENNF